ncbi:MAG: tetratricopeptide repeat protein [Myxococcales bacterium]|nr:tetratricopeptide repeat protein [Myxococcales bacterium]
MRAACLALLLLGGSTASAQEAPAEGERVPSEAAVAREAFQQGIAAARAGDWPAARAHFERSYALRPRASALFNLAGAQVQTGALVQAAESYREYLGRGDDPSAERAAEAAAALARLEARIPTVRVTATGLEPNDELRLDGDAIDRRLLEGPIPVDPGARRFEVVRDGHVVASEQVDAAEGAHLEVTLDVPPPAPPDLQVTEPPPDPAPVILPPVTPDPDPPDEGEDVLGSWWLWTLVGAVVLGGLAAGLAVAFTTPGAPPDSHGFLTSDPVRVP